MFHNEIIANEGDRLYFYSLSIQKRGKTAEQCDGFHNQIFDKNNEFYILPLGI